MIDSTISRTKKCKGTERFDWMETAPGVGVCQKPFRRTEDRPMAAARQSRAPSGAGEVHSRLKIWGRLNSTNVQKVLLACEEMGLVYDRVDAGLQFGVNKTEDYLQMNPNGEHAPFLFGFES